MSDDHPYNLLAHFGYWYEQSGNPLHAWQALAWCFDTGAPLPEWVYAYLRDAAKKMSVLAGGRDFRKKPYPRITPDDSAKLVGEALGLWRPKTKNAFKRLVQDSMAQRAALNELENYSYAIPRSATRSDRACWLHLYRRRQTCRRDRADARRAAAMSDDHPYNLLTHFGYWYKQSGNPLHAWQALDYCFDTGAPIPEWVCAYLRDAAKKMSILAGGRDFRKKPSPRINPDDSAKLVGEALGLWRPKTKSAFKRLVQDSMAQRAALNELENYSYATPADIASLPPVPIVDEKGKPLFHKGKPVGDEKGKPAVDEKGEPLFVDEKGKPVVDEKGKPVVDEKGKPLFHKGPPKTIAATKFFDPVVRAGGLNKEDRQTRRIIVRGHRLNRTRRPHKSGASDLSSPPAKK